MSLVKNIWNALIDWAEELNEYRRKNNIHRMF